MKCPLCDTELETPTLDSNQAGHCPNCGWMPEDGNGMEASEKQTRYADLPGIYYSVLEEESENAPEKPRKAFLAKLREWWQGMDEASRKNTRFVGVMAGIILLLFVVITCAYNPNAAAFTGNSGVTMSNRDFLIYYRTAMTNYAASNRDGNGNVALPFNPSKRLDRQYYDLNSGYSWQDYFMDSALSQASLTRVLVLQAEKEGFVLPEKAQEDLDAQKAAFDALSPAEAKAAVEERYGPKADAGAYLRYLKDTAVAQAYYESLVTGYTFTAAEIQDYYNRHKDSYAQLSVSETPDVTLRHILYIPESERQEDWDAAEARAQATLEKIQAAADKEEMFLSLTEESQDAGSKENGGLMERVYAGAIGGPFDSWCFDPAGHEAGELAVVMSEYGWHVILFEGYCDSASWQSVVLDDMRVEKANYVIEALRSEADCRLTIFAEVP